MVVCVDNNSAVACGAFKARTQEQVEIKRMYVAESHRRKGLAQKMLLALEAWAAELGYCEAVLETGKAQIEALSFYPKLGCRVIPNFSL